MTLGNTRVAFFLV